MRNGHYFSVQDLGDKPNKDDELLSYLLDLEEVKLNVESKPHKNKK